MGRVGGLPSSGCESIPEGLSRGGAGRQLRGKRMKWLVGKDWQGYSS